MRRKFLLVNPTKLRLMLFDSRKDGGIFLSYRRSDARGYAGRLSDSLEDYFGSNRVFRDIEDIEGGASFGDVIHNNIKGADAAIILIGPTWLSTTNPDGGQRLFAEGDWVAAEIANVLDKGIPIIPVLIEQTPFPRTSELPEKLQKLTQFNAMYVSDKNWDHDVLRLGKVLSFDIPSANVRKVFLAKCIIAFSMVVSVGFTLWWLFDDYNTIFSKKVNNLNLEKAKNVEELTLPLFELWVSGMPLIGIWTAVILTLYILPLIDEASKKYLIYSVAIGVIGTLVDQFFLWKLDPPLEAIWGLCINVFISVAMLCLMMISGFKVK